MKQFFLLTAICIGMSTVVSAKADTVCGKVVYASEVVFEIENGPKSTLIVRINERHLASNTTLGEARADIESAWRKPDYYSVCVETAVLGYPKSNVYLRSTKMERQEKTRRFRLDG